jgi:hypothetical protein
MVATRQIVCRVATIFFDRGSIDEQGNASQDREGKSADTTTNRRRDAAANYFL